jgi:hypothetical protein
MCKSERSTRLFTDLLDGLIRIYFDPDHVIGNQAGTIFLCQAEIAMDADAAALIAVAEINQRVFEESGDLTPTGQTWAMPMSF